MPPAWPVGSNDSGGRWPVMATAFSSAPGDGWKSTTPQPLLLLLLPPFSVAGLLLALCVPAADTAAPLVSTFAVLLRFARLILVSQDARWIISLDLLLLLPPLLGGAMACQLLLWPEPPDVAEAAAAAMCDADADDSVAVLCVTEFPADVAAVPESVAVLVGEAGKSMKFGSVLTMWSSRWRSTLLSELRKRDGKTKIRQVHFGVRMGSYNCQIIMTSINYV